MAIVATDRQSVRTSPPGSPTWQEELRDAVRDPLELCRLLDLPSRYRAALESPAARSAARAFPLFAPRGYIARMRSGDPHDPLLRQVLPLDVEDQVVPGFTADPLGEGPATLAPGLLQKYRGRALVVSTGACAIHCRYCFRRHFPYPSPPLSGAQQWQPVLSRLAADTSLEEVILSGGDPLTLVDDTLADLIRQLAEIPHLRRVRWHTRLPVVIPARVTDDLTRLIRSTRLTPVFVIHANHAAEIDTQVALALQRLVDQGIPVLNQAVLLRGVNDRVEALAELCRTLIDLRVMPYYLHQLDRVAGAAHFEVPEARGRELITQLRALLPGYAVPRYVCEIAGDTEKRVLA